MLLKYWSICLLENAQNRKDLRNVIYFLGELAGDRADVIDALANLARNSLDNSQSPICASIFYTLTKIGSSYAINTLSAFFHNHQNEEIRHMASEFFDLFTRIDNSK